LVQAALSSISASKCRRDSAPDGRDAERGLVLAERIAARRIWHLTYFCANK
jgi:hypothetical protein